MTGRFSIDALAAPGTRDASTYLRGDGTWAELIVGGAGGGGSSGVLDYVAFAPATQATYTPPAEGSPADVDATNAALTFVVPESGIVYVRAQFSINSVTNSGIFLMLREDTTTVAGTKCRRGYLTGVGGSQLDVTCDWVIVGLTPGDIHTYKLGFERFGTSTGTPTQIIAGGAASWGPLTMVAMGAASDGTSDAIDGGTWDSSYSEPTIDGGTF